MQDKVKYGVEAGIATIAFNRPDVMNALDEVALLAFRSVCERAVSDAAAKVIVLRGEGPAFLAGGDVAMFRSSLPYIADKVSGLTDALHGGLLALRESPQLVIASVHGAVAGAGMSIALAADLIVAAEGTRFATAYSRMGTSPDGGMTWFLPHLVGYQRAMELLLLSESVGADVMQAMGVVNRVVPANSLESETLKIAQRLAEGPLRAYAESKKLVNRAIASGLGAHLAEEAGAFKRSAVTGDFAEGVTAFVDKRKPCFTGK